MAPKVSNPLQLSPHALKAWDNIQLSFPWKGHGKMSLRSRERGSENTLLHAVLEASSQAHLPHLKHKILWPLFEELIEKGASLNAVNQEGKTALHAASLQGWHEAVHALLEKGATANPKMTNPYTASIETPLSLAISQGHLPVVKRLLDEKIDWNALEVRQGQKRPAWKYLLDNEVHIKSLPVFLDKGHFIQDVELEKTLNHPEEVHNAYAMLPWPKSGKPLTLPEIAHLFEGCRQILEHHRLNQVVPSVSRSKTKAKL